MANWNAATPRQLSHDSCGGRLVPGIKPPQEADKAWMCTETVECGIDWKIKQPAEAFLIRLFEQIEHMVGFLRIVEKCKGAKERIDSSLARYALQFPTN